VRFLLDTHALLWALMDEKRLHPKACRHISNSRNQVYFSPVSIFELGIKEKQGKLRAKSDIQEAINACRFLPLPLSASHAWQAAQLPMVHSDPFDRLLIAQAQLENLTLITRDQNIPLYDVVTLEA
jgi:PIN domain nuclease of toxin-antitoxin system